MYKRVMNICLLIVLCCLPLLTACSDGGWGHREGETFDFYAGPVIPMTFMESQADIIVSRNIDFNFSKYSEEYERGAIVRDTYELHNDSQAEITVTAAYPFVGSFNLQEMPIITAGQSEIDYEIHAGAYTGGFTGGGGASSSLNLQDARSWNEYADLLEDGTYFTDAFSALKSLEQPVVVYKLHDIVNRGEEADAATLCMQLDYDSEKTMLFTFGFNGGGTQEETGIEYRDFFLREWKDRPDGQVKYLIALGQDLAGYTLQGYQNGACLPGTELDGIEAEVTRVETTLGEALRELSKIRYDAVIGDTNSGGAVDRYINEKVSFEQYYEQVIVHFLQNGPLSSNTKERYDFGLGAGRLDEFVSETISLKRILYLTFDLTIPAGETLPLNVVQLKPASCDYLCEEKGSQDLDGYDMTTVLGSNLRFRKQTASISGYDAIKIVRQNFGFDLAAGSTEAELALDETRYYLEVRKK